MRLEEAIGTAHIRKYVPMQELITRLVHTVLGVALHFTLLGLD